MMRIGDGHRDTCQWQAEGEPPAPVNKMSYSNENQSAFFLLTHVIGHSGKAEIAYQSFQLAIHYRSRPVAAVSLKERETLDTGRLRVGFPGMYIDHHRLSLPVKCPDHSVRIPVWRVAKKSPSGNLDIAAEEAVS